MNKLNMINKYNKLISILIITISMIVGISGVRGVTFIPDKSSSSVYKMISCKSYTYEGDGKNYFNCWFDSGDMGLRFTIINSKKEKVSGTQSINYFSNVTFEGEGSNPRNDVIYYYLGDNRYTRLYIKDISYKYCGYKKHETGCNQFELKRVFSEQLHIPVLNGDTNEILGYNNIINEIKSGQKLVYDILNDTKITVDDFVKNNYEILIEPIYVIGYGEDNYQGTFALGTFALGTASEIAKHMYNYASNQKGKIDGKVYTRFLLGINFPFNLAYNLCKSEVENGDRCTSNKKLESVDNSTKTDNLFKIPSNLSKIYNNWGYGMSVIQAKDIPTIVVNGQIEISKSNGYKMLQNIEFNIYKGGSIDSSDETKCKGGTKVKGTFKTDNAGIVRVNDLKDGKYCVEEASKLSGHKKSKAQIANVKSGSTSAVKLYFINDVENKNLTITKKDNNGNTIEGVEFLLDGPLTSVGGSKGITDKKGVVSFSPLHIDEYSLYEKIKEGYSKDSSDVKVTASTPGLNVKILESDRPDYDVMFKFTINAEHNNINITISNKEIGCAEEFERLGAVNSLEIRYKLYKKYEDEDGNHFNNLLNMSIPNGETACTYTACKIVSDDRCLVTNFHSEYDYHATNSTSLALDPKDTGYACYTDVINDGSQDIGICNTDFKFRNRFGAGGANFVFEAERGLAFTNTTEAGTGTLTKTCESIIGGRNLTTPSIEKANDNNIKVELNYNNVNVVKKGEASIKNEQGNNTPNISYEIETEFSFLNSYITRGPTGELKLKKFKNAYISGYFMSSIDDPIPNNTIGEIEFGYSLEYTSDNRAYSTSGGKLGNSSKACKYKLTDGLIPGGDPGKRSLNIEFRTIDINDPFPGKDGKGRTVGVNWLGKCLPMIVDDGSGSAVELNPLDISVCDTKSNSNLMNYLVSYAKSHGINRKDIDGSLTGIDLPEFANFFNKKNIILANYINKINAGNYDYSSKRSIVDKYITYATNSYGQQKDSTGKIKYKKPIYTMVLTPSDIKQIREYNKETSYDDYVSVSGKICDRDAGDTDECFLDKENYEMKFIEGIKNTNTPTITTLKNKTLLKLKNSLKTA